MLDSLKSTRDVKRLSLFLYVYYTFTIKVKKPKGTIVPTFQFLPMEYLCKDSLTLSGYNNKVWNFIFIFLISPKSYY